MTPLALLGQATIYSEGFNNPCGAPCTATAYGWTIQNNIGGTNGSSPNNWLISCEENGENPGICGAGCGADPTLHVTDPVLLGGARFNETGAVNATFRRAVSPTISTVGFSTNTLQFDFIAFGSAACSDDRAQLHLSTDNGATWPVGFQYCLNTTCCIGACNGYDQGLWTLYTLALPAAFNNNPNVRIGFYWRNNGNGSGTDPSVAIDDVRITTVVAPVVLTAFSALPSGKDVALAWEVTEETQMRHYDIERATTPGQWQSVGTVGARGAASKYSFHDRGALSGTLYYRLKMVEADGHAEYSRVVRVVAGQDASLELATADRNGAVIWSAAQQTVEISLHDMGARLIRHQPEYHLISGENRIDLDPTALPAGAYMLTIKTLKTPPGMQPVRVSRKLIL